MRGPRRSSAALTESRAIPSGVGDSAATWLRSPPTTRMAVSSGWGAAEATVSTALRMEELSCANSTAARVRVRVPWHCVNCGRPLLMRLLAGGAAAEARPERLCIVCRAC